MIGSWITRGLKYLLYFYSAMMTIQVAAMFIMMFRAPRVTESHSPSYYNPKPSKPARSTVSKPRKLQGASRYVENYATW